MTWTAFFTATIALLVLVNLVSADFPGTSTTRNEGDESGRSSDKKQPPPNILFVLIDDLGWGDVGYHHNPATASAHVSEEIIMDAVDYEQRRLRRRPEVQTPVMDRLATREGLELNRHYVHSSCTGTRTSLQSGRFPVHVQTSLKNPENPSSGMPRNLTGLAEHMKKSRAYATHYVGKWDVGMASPRHTPHGRGYDTSLNYFEHKNDYWTQECTQSACCRHHLLLQQEQESQDGSKIYDLWDTDQPARNLTGTDYEEFIFKKRMEDIIDQHAATGNNSLFLFYAPHVAHCPLQVPQSYLDQIDVDDDEGLCQKQTANIVGPNRSAVPYSCRRQYHAMVKLLDDILGSLVDRLKANEMWENTLMVVTSDNGGPIGVYESASTNWPNRGGKYSDWEGGVRSVAFVSGGFIPEERRGQVVQDPIHICDWYATLPALAGVLVHEEESTETDDQKVPPVDAVDVWSLIAGDKATAPPPRHEIPLSRHALIVGKYKLLWNTDEEIGMAGWTYPTYPNAKTQPNEIEDQTVNCSTGCLFNVDTDPGEHQDIAALEPVRVQQMKKRLQELRQGFYENDEQGIDSCPKGFNDKDRSLLCACWAAVNYYGGFLGPWQEVDRLAEASISQES